MQEYKGRKSAKKENTSNNLRQSLSPGQVNTSLTPLNGKGYNPSHKSNASAGSIYDFEILSTGNAFQGPQNLNLTGKHTSGAFTLNGRIGVTSPLNAAAKKIHQQLALDNLEDEDMLLKHAKVLSRDSVEMMDIDYRVKFLMDN